MTMTEVFARHMEAERRRDAKAAAATFTEDCHYFVAPLGLRLRGREQIEQWYSSLFAAVPDYDDLPVDQWTCETEQGNFVLYQAEMSGTHRRTWHGWRATNRAFRVPMLVRIPFADDGLMLAEEVYFDSADLLAQLGIAPGHGSAGERVLQRMHSIRIGLTSWR